MTKPYFTLAVFNSAASRWEIAFGDFTKEVVKQELEDMRDDKPRRMFKILRTTTAEQGAIESAVAELNTGKS